MKVIPAREMYALPKSSQQYLEDSAVNVDVWLGDKCSDKFARIEATGFMSGNVPTRPRGILTYSNGTTWGTIEQIVSGSSGAFTYTGLLNLITGLKEPYHANAKFLVRRQSIASIMLLTDGSNRLIFQPIQGGNFNGTPLLGYQIRYATDMAAIASGSLSLAFGDFKRGYTIVDRLGISLIRDNVTAKPYSRTPFISKRSCRNRPTT